MKSNVGGIDRIARIALGAILIALTLAGQLPVWGWVGVIPLATGLIGWCPVYLPFKISTKKEGEA